MSVSREGPRYAVEASVPRVVPLGQHRRPGAVPLSCGNSLCIHVGASRLPVMAELSAEVRALLGARNMAHVATLMPDGSPHVSPVWIAVEGDRLAIFSARENRKVANLRRDGRVAVSVCDEHNPYRSVVVRGRVVEELQGDEAVEIMDRMSNRYVGTDFPMRSAIVSLIEPERVHLQDLPFHHPSDTGT